MEAKKSEISDKWLYLAVILIGLFFIFKLYDFSKVISQFPLDSNNDLSSYIGQLYFLNQYGFHQNVPNWYNGFTSFLLYPPGWFFFTLPIYLILGDILLATYISSILVYLIGFLSVCLLKKFAKLSWTKSLFLYLFVFVNPISVGNFIKLGRLPELLSLSLFIMFFAFFIYYKEKESTKGFILLSFLYAGILLAHPSFFVISSFFIPPLFMLKKGRGKIWISVMFAASILMASFWLVPFIKASSQTSLTQNIAFTGLSRLLELRKEFFFDNLFSFILPAVFLACFYFYYRSLSQQDRRKELLFYSIPLIFSLLFFFRVAAFIPIANKLYPDSYNVLFIFLSVFIFLKTPKESYGGFAKIIKTLLILSPVLIILPSVFFVSNFRQNNVLDKEIISILKYVNGKYLMARMPYPTYVGSFDSYAAIYYSLSTPSGWYPQAASNSLLDRIAELRDEFEKPNPNCNNVNMLISELEVDELILQKEQCMPMENCGLKEKVSTDRICLLSK